MAAMTFSLFLEHIILLLSLGLCTCNPILFNNPFLFYMFQLKDCFLREVFLTPSNFRSDYSFAIDFQDLVSLNKMIYSNFIYIFIGVVVDEHAFFAARV